MRNVGRYSTANAMNDKPKSSVYILTAVISAIAVIIAAVLSHESVIREILRMVRTKTVTIHASSEFSGASIYLAGDDMLTFLEARKIVAVGDTDADQLTKGFLSFYLGEIPVDAEIIAAEIKIPCNVEGSPELLGTLTLQEYAFGRYSQAIFYGVPSNNWAVEWTNTASTVNVCRSMGSLAVSGNALAKIVHQRLASGWIQFVLYFKGDLIIPDQNIDAIVLTTPPVLVLRYQQGEP